MACKLDLSIADLTEAAHIYHDLGDCQRASDLMLIVGMRFLNYIYNMYVKKLFYR